MTMKTLQHLSFYSGFDDVACVCDMLWISERVLVVPLYVISTWYLLMQYVGDQARWISARVAVSGAQGLMGSNPES